MMGVRLRILFVTALLLPLIVGGRPLRAQSLFADTDESAGSPQGVLLLRNGSSLPGEFRPHDSGEAIAWQVRDFTRPFEFPVGNISAINFPVSVPPLKMEGEYAVELQSGDLISGRLIDWNDGFVALETLRFGLVRIREQAVRRLDRIDENALVLFSGLSGLADWQTVKGEWKVEGTELTTREPDSRLVGDFKIPDKAVIEFELSWSEKTPNFSFAIGIDPASPPNAPSGWSFDTWNSELILVRGRPDIAAIEPIQKLDPDVRGIRLIAFLDQPGESMRVYLPNGTLVTQASLPPLPADKTGQTPQQNATGISFTSHAGETRLKRLRVARWDGSLPLTPDSKGSRIRLSDDRAISGEVTGFDRSSRTMTVREESGDVSFALDQIVSAEFGGVDSMPLRSLILALQDQTRISGELLSIDERRLLFRIPDLEAPVEVERELVRSIALRATDAVFESNASWARTGSMELGGHRLAGHLEPATVTEDASCLVWHPDGSRNASPLNRTASGRIIYRERTPPAPRDPNHIVVQEVQQEPGLLGQLGKLLMGGGAGDPNRRVPQQLGESHDLHLVSGDVVPCRVTSIDERGVHFNSSSAEVSWIPHAKIKALVLVRSKRALELDEEKKQRLLTLPRNQKHSPPTHLLYSDRGDFLRCRVNSLADEQLRVELHLSEIELPLERVSHIIWLHPEIPSNEKKQSVASPDDPLVAPREVPAEGPPPLHETQVILASDTRSTFTPREIGKERIIGQSDVIGECNFELRAIDQIVFGRGIEVAARDLPFHQWVLTPAPDPLYVQAAEGGSPSDDGRVSAFVGKPAPDFGLDLLSGEKFVLSEARGKIIVLDFWATWCGPCMMTMPLMEEAMKSFDPEQVQLISVNLEERPEQIKDVMERHNLTSKVALDRDGVVARRYQVDSIPQLIIIDRRGVIARLYVGGGQNIVDQFKTALTEILAAPDDTQPEPSAGK